jgi:hypothetical protein
MWDRGAVAKENFLSMLQKIFPYAGDSIPLGWVIQPEV